ncbi:flagellar hook-length control protein FliK [Marinobacterium iners]|uniref:Hook-length control protein FliK n=1 Tax=Marinobacterium iners DSM 11526 TaxID=1122198 RepID=A0A1H3YEE7_9GAMM|nr:flagellar hook-length control protein FliK [Marinobacterium iners]SEA09292.1 hook-length control protein FliK [Marinobacterium iners DSM 11526]
MLTPTTSSTTPAAGTNKGGSADSLLPAAGRELAATVRSVAASGGNAAVFRIQVEINSRLLELTTQAPLTQGDRIVLQRGNTGELQIRLPAPAQPNVQGNATPAAQSSMTLQLTSSDGARLQQLLPLNVPRNAQVTGSEPVIPRQPAAATSPQPGAGTTPAETSAKPAAAYLQPPGGNTSQGATQGNAATTSGNNSSLQGRTQPTGNAPTPARSESPAAQATSGSRQPAGTVTGQTPAPGQPPSSATPSSQATQVSPSGTTSSQVQVYSAQLQSSAISQVSTATSTTTPTNQPPAAQTQAAGSEARPAAPAPTTQATSPDTAAKTQTAPANSTARASTPASTAVQTAQTTTQPSVSHTGQALLQTLGKQVPVQADNHMIRLNLNNQTLNLISPKPLLSGQQVVLTRVSEQQVNLQPVPIPTTPSQEAKAQQQMQLALREALPRQIPFGDALNQLVQLSQSPAGRSQGAIGQLVQSMLSMFSVSPGSADAEQAIQRNLQQGGLLTESRLAQGGGTERGATPDLKQQLGQLLKAAEQLPPDARQQMTRLVEALQARSTTQQVSSLQGWKDQPDGTQERVYRLDLPIRQADQHDNAELTITEQRRRSSGGEVETLWGVALHFDLEQHGSVDARLSLSEEWRLQVQLWAEQASTLRQIERRLDDFSDGLHRKGFLVETLQARQGRPSQPELTDVQRRLVDIHT